MRRLRDVLVTLILLTTLDDKPVYVESTSVAIVRHSLDCAHGHATAVLVQGKPLCVKETVDEVREKVKAGNQVPW